MKALLEQIRRDCVDRQRKQVLAGEVALEASKSDKAFAESLQGHLDASLVNPVHRSMFGLTNKK